MQFFFTKSKLLALSLVAAISAAAISFTPQVSIAQTSKSSTSISEPIALNQNTQANLQKSIWPNPPDIAAKSYMLVDVNAGQILAANNIDDPAEPASLTKLMSAYLVFDALKNGKITLEQTMPVSQRAWKMIGSRMFIPVNAQIPVEDLIKGMIVQSGNDATVTLAEGVGGSVENFVQMMNNQAQILGMKGTTYKNPEGLTEAGHKTTTRDLATLATRLLKDFPEYTHYYKIQKYKYSGTPASNDTNRNLLLFRDPTVDGLKTGHTAAAGYCLVATAQRDFPQIKGRRLISVVMGAVSENTRANESQKLLNWGYTAYDGVKLFDAGQLIAEPKVWKGKVPKLKLGSANPVTIAIPAGMGGKVTTEIIRPDPLIAPFTKNQTVASLKIKLDGQNLNEVPLIALEDVPQSGWFGQMLDAIKMWFS